MRAFALAVAALATTAMAGPVEKVLEGPRFCPRDRPAAARPIDAAEAIARSRAWLPDGFCGPAAGVDGCDADVEHLHDTFRVYFHQYKRRDGRHDWSRLAHTYVILDAVGNCVAHIPGTGTFENAH